MNHDECMMRAIELAKESEKSGGAPIGAIIVSADGNIIGEGVSLVAVSHDPTGHSETIAIRKAAEKIRSINLGGCRLYSTCESCGMCLSAMAWANISEAYFGVSAAEIPENSYELKDYSSVECASRTQTWDSSPIQVRGGILGKECAALFDGYVNWSKHAKISEDI